MIFMRACCKIHEWFMNEKKTAAGAHKKIHEQVAQFDFWSWGCTFHEQGSWTKGIFTEQRKLYRLILFLLATKRAWSAPGRKIEFVYERIMRRLWIFHEWLHLAAGSRDRGICLRNPSKNTPQKPYVLRFPLGFWVIFYAFPWEFELFFYGFPWDFGAMFLKVFFGFWFIF